jgi:hypothetical protein
VDVYKWGGLALLALFALAAAASYHGWGVTTDAQAAAQQAGSVRSGSVGRGGYHRSYYGGGYRFGK